MHVIFTSAHSGVCKKTTAKASLSGVIFKIVLEF